VKIHRNGFFYLCLAGLAAVPAFGQGTAQNAPGQNPTSQNPASQTPPAQTAPAQNQTSQNPASQNPTSQQPAAEVPPPQTPPTAPVVPSQTAPPSGGPIVNAPPELPKYPDVRLPGEYGFFIGLNGWIPSEQPIFDKGRNSGYTANSHVLMQGKPKFSGGGEVGIALGLHNMLRLSYLQTRAAGDYTTPVDTVVFNGQVYTAGTFVSTDYTLRNMKISFDYLTWPYPVESRRFRLKTLWQLQYTSVKAGFDAPLLPLTDSNGNPLIDASGNPISYAASESKWFLLPTFGLSATEYFTRNIRFEASADGFAIPHHSTTYEGEATINARVNHFELRGGFKYYHYKTSTSSDFYMRGTLSSVFFGIRWYSR
jgi:hypothetical protein